MKDKPWWNTKESTEKIDKEVHHLYMEAYVRLEKAKRIVEELGWAWEHGKIESLMRTFDFLMENQLHFKKDLPKYRKKNL